MDTRRASDFSAPPTDPHVQADAAARPPRLRLGPQRRVRSSTDFRRILDHGRRVNDGVLTVWARPNELGYSRLGLTVSKQHGGAVQRNRLKRLVREAFRLRYAELPVGYDIVCSPRRGVRLTLVACREALVRLAARACTPAGD